jgi:CheY-like chemotaxis protein
VDRLSVLVVDDDADTADSTAALLTLWGHEARVCRTGWEALAAAPGFGPQVVLLDLGLPRMDGCEVARRLRQRMGAVVLAALTGYGDAPHAQQAREAGFDHLFVKPADPEELQRWLAGQPNSREE